MLFVILGILLFFVMLGLWGCTRDNTITWNIVGVAVFLLPLGTCVMGGKPAENDLEPSSITPLYSINCSSGATKNFCLGFQGDNYSSHTCMGATYYSYIKEGEYLKLIRIRSNNSLVLESDEQPALLVYTCSGFKAKYLFTCEDKKVIRIPKGAIIQNFQS